jgi:predicted nucleic acid-binding protein
MFSVVLDTCVLLPPTLADTILRVAESGIVGVRWSTDILAELERVMLRKGVCEDAVERRLAAMEQAFPDAAVRGYEPLIASMTNDPDDRHVLAAAIASDAHTLVTFNLKHFPDASLAPNDVTAVHPDAFLLDQLDLHPGAVMGALRAQSTA